MQIEILMLRMLHIVFGVFWAGSAIFFAIILQPSIQTLEPTTRRHVMGAVVPVMGPALIGSAVITIVAGITLGLRLRWGHLDAFINTEWGWAMLIGLVTSLGAISSGVSAIVHANRMIRLSHLMEDRSLTPEQLVQMERIAARLPRLSRTTAVLVIIAICSMASARFV